MGIDEIRYFVLNSSKLNTKQFYCETFVSAIILSLELTNL